MDAVKRSVFISFSSQDRKVTETIGAALESRGYPCWISSRDIGPGENYQIAIVHAINAAKVLLLIFSSNTNTSDEIKKELALASRRRLVVIPVRIEDVVPDEGFSYELATRQWIDLFGDWEKAMGQLADQIGTLVPAQPHLSAAAGDVASPFLPRTDTTAAKPFALPSPKILALAAAGLVLAAALFYFADQRLSRHDTDESAAVPVPAVPQPGAGVPVPAVPQPGAVDATMPASDLMKCFVADPRKAIEGCTEALSKPGLSATARANYLKFRGSAYGRSLDYDRALADYDSAIAIDPSDPVAFFLRAAVRRVKGDGAGADADLTHAKALGYTTPH
ncbi:MAG TPA: TIR domain-containing protein [Rhizomicrobium sp.]|jgi:hypothetical protein|nr:TIR domain-containing protein [Rhizomicrobium sp.]